MTQAIVQLPGSPLTGAAAAADINGAFASIITMFGGTSAPTLGPGGANALVVGQDWLNTSVTPYVWNKWDGSAWCPWAQIDPTNHLVLPPLSYRNIIGDNGGFEVWQRGAGSSASFSVSASTTQYVADRWYIATAANEAMTVAAVAGLTGNSNLAAKITRNSGQTGTATMQIGYPLDTDEIVRVRGKIVTLTAVVKTGANFSPGASQFAIVFVTGTGSPVKQVSGYSGQVIVIDQAFTLAPSTTYTLTATASAAVAANATQAEVAIDWSPTGTAGADDSFTIDDVQLEIGMSTQFERVPFDKMLLGCKRHYQTTFPYGTAPAQNAGVAGALGFTSQITTAASAFTQWNFPVEQRASPSITTFNPSASNANWRDVTGSSDVTVSVDPNSAKSTKGVFVSSQTTALTAVHNLYIHAAADAGI